MNSAAKSIQSDNQTIDLLPRWITLPQAETPETVAFLSGAALAMLDVMLRDPGGRLPAALLRDRLALKAAAACLKLENRTETAFDIRDAVCLARVGDALGPAGEMFVAWRKLARISLTTGGWKDRAGKVLPAAVADVAMSRLGSLSGTPVEQAGQILVDVLRQFPREEAAALMLADVALARAVGWDRLVPLLAAHMECKEVRAISEAGDDAVQAVHQAMVAACDGAIRLAADVDRRVAKLRAVAPKLRAKGSDDAVEMFVSEDAMMPAALPLADRAARRLCDRLVDLGAVRELTGRSTFRLYGV
jgi:hypothetical protein